MLNPILINLSFLFSQPTGISTYAGNLIPYLQSLNPLLLTAKYFPEFQCYPIPDNLTPQQGSKGHLRRLLWTQLQLPQIYKQLKSSLLFSPIPEAPLYSPCRFIVTVHDLIPLRFPNPYSPITYYFRHYIPQVLQQAEHIICNSQATAKDIVDFFGISPKKITPILLAYDSQLLKPTDELTANSQAYFLYIGRQDPYKNLHRLINAFGKIAKYCNRQLWLAGPTDRRYTPQLQAQIQELELTEKVKFLNYVPRDRFPILIQNALAVVFPSLWEGFGFPALEAMACGTPIIASNLSAIPEVVGDAGILIDPYQTEAIAAAMQSLVDSSQLRVHLSQLGLSRASQFSWEKTGAATVEVIERYH
jgi:glycosyltransferase involved in cell wall biosynthesis